MFVNIFVIFMLYSDKCIKWEIFIKMSNINDVNQVVS